MYDKSHPIVMTWTARISTTPTLRCCTNLEKVPALFLAISGATCIGIYAWSSTNVSQIILTWLWNCAIFKLSQSQCERVLKLVPGQWRSWRDYQDNYPGLYSLCVAPELLVLSNLSNNTSFFFCFIPEENERAQKSFSAGRTFCNMFCHSWSWPKLVDQPFSSFSTQKNPKNKFLISGNPC